MNKQIREYTIDKSGVRRRVYTGPRDGKYYNKNEIINQPIG